MVMHVVSVTESAGGTGGVSGTPGTIVITPGPVVATIAAVGYAAHGIAGGLLAAAVAFTPSFS